MFPESMGHFFNGVYAWGHQAQVTTHKTPSKMLVGFFSPHHPLIPTRSRSSFVYRYHLVTD